MHKAALFALVGSCLAQDTTCPPLELIYARATTEPPQNVDYANATTFEAAAAMVWSKGYGAAGASLLSNVTALIPGAAGYPVHYPASYQGAEVFEDSSPGKGTLDMVARLNARAEECPETKFALGGHSQGGYVTVLAIMGAKTDALKQVIAVTMFGTSACPPIVKDRCKSYCNSGDTVCDSRSVPPTPEATAAVDSFCGTEIAETGHVAIGGPGINQHLAYNKDGFYVKAAACYIKQKFSAAK